MSIQHVEPLNMDSPKGRRIAAELTELLGRIAADIAERRSQAADSGNDEIPGRRP